MDKGPVDVALVRMPYSELGQPSLALGLLKAVCTRHGLSSRVLPVNMWFAEEIGPAIHDMIFQAYSTTLIGEWTFAGALFPDYHPDDDAYLRKVVGVLKLDTREQWRHIHERYPYVDTITLLRELRSRAADFVERMATAVLELEPTIVGCSSTFQQHCASLALLRAVKRRRPDIVTMIGGANCEGQMGRTTFEQFPWIDILVSGEADGFFGQLCRRLIEQGLDSLTRADLPEGVWGPPHRFGQAASPQTRPATGEGAVPLVQHAESAGKALTMLRVVQASEEVDGAPIARLDNMDESPIPDYDDYFAYLSETQALSTWTKAALPYQTARGCWWGEKTHCTFCGISRTAMKFRSKSSDNVIDQIVSLRDRYGITHFQGTEYIFDYKYFETLLPRLKEIGGYYRFEVKANLKASQLQAFVDGGTLEVQPGVESLHDKTLALLKKGTTAYQNLLLLKRARKVGLLVYWNMLHTIPGDRDEWYGEMADMLPLLSHLQSPYGCGQIHYDRFSPYWKDPARHGLDLIPGDGYAYVYPFPPELLKEMAYFFETPRQRHAFYRLNPDDNGGLLRLIDRVFAWKDKWRVKRAPPELVANDCGDRTEFTDTRDVAVARSFAIDGLAHRIYWLAEEGVRPAALVEKLRELDPTGFDEAAMHAAVDRLKALKVLLAVSDRLLALAVAAPVSPFLAHSLKFPRAAMNPSWSRLRADEDLDRLRPNIAASCLRAPEDQPLSAWLAPVRHSRASARRKREAERSGAA
jgi:ribosomal peptide maturation radical SAM protein 1